MSALGRLRRATGVLAPLLGLAVTVVMANQLAGTIDYHALVHAVRGLAWQPVLGAVAATAASFITLILRDGLALRYAGATAPRSAIVLSGFCGTSLSNTVGILGLSAAAVRYRIYGSVGIRPEAVARVIALISAGFAVGLIGFVALATLAEAIVLAPLVGWSPAVLRGAALGTVIAILIVGFLCRDRQFALRGIAMRFPDATVSLALVGLTTFDLVFTAAGLWLLLPPVGMSFLAFTTIFAVAVAIGGVSHVPGGLGVFEAVFLFAFGARVSPDLLAAGLLVFRVTYFILPLVVSTALLASFELRRAARPQDPARDDGLLNSAACLVPTFLAALTFGAGAILVVSGATPTFHHRLAVLAVHVPLWIIETAQFFASVAGLILMFVARGLYRRLDGAWWLATPLTMAASILSLLYGLAYAQASLLAMLFIMLLVARQQFPRRASLTCQPFTRGWWVAVGAVLAAAVWIFGFAFENAQIAQGVWWKVAFDAQAPRALRATLGVCIVGVVLGLTQLLRVAKGSSRLPDQADLDRAMAIIERQDRSEALLALMGDKSLMFSASGQAFLMFATRGRSWIALYDPVGPRSEWGELIGRFVALAAGHGGRAAFYHVRPDSLPFYIDAGLQTVKLGEEARVELSSFHLKGAHRSHLRYALKRGEREAMSFEFLPSERVGPLMPDLERVSAAWLATRRTREKGFSVAAFDRDYLATQSFALVRRRGDLIAFASIMASADRGEATTGLMRHVAGVSPYTMEFLFVSLILALKEDGYGTLSLGTAPLSGLVPTPLGLRWYRLAHLIWRHGSLLYNFQGLRTFKGKFDPVWEPRYLAVSGSMGPFFALADAAALANGGTQRRGAP